MANGDAAAVAKSLKNDNRTVVGSKVRGAATVVIATSVGPEGSVLTNASGTALTPESATSAATLAGLDADDIEGQTLVVPHLPNLTGDEYDKRNCRTQWFHTGNYDSSKAAFGAKRCYVSKTGAPLDDAGAPTTVALAIDAETTPLAVTQDALGEVVSNYEQVYRTDPDTRSVEPGKYLAHPFQTSLYAPYAGWTAQQG